MAFTVEDGTGLTNSNAYITTAFADSYHSDRGNCGWETFSTVKKQQAIVRATFYIDKRFGSRFRGDRQNSQQNLAWPRTDAVDNSDFLLQGVPKQLQWATAEYALRTALIGELAPDPKMLNTAQDFSDTETSRTGDVSSGTVKSKKVSVGGGAVSQSIEYVDPSESMKYKSSGSSLVSGYNIPEYPGADMYLEELIRGLNVSKIVRGC